MYTYPATRELNSLPPKQARQRLGRARYGEPGGGDATKPGERTWFFSAW